MSPTHINLIDRETPMEHPLVLRERPTARCGALRYQIGMYEQRIAIRPIYDRKGKIVLRHEPFPENDFNHKVRVFRLLGFGSTQKRAEQKAQTAMNRMPSNDQALRPGASETHKSK